MEIAYWRACQTLVWVQAHFSENLLGLVLGIVIFVLLVLVASTVVLVASFVVEGAGGGWQTFAAAVPAVVVLVVAVAALASEAVVWLSSVALASVLVRKDAAEGYE